MTAPILLRAGTLWPATAERARAALACGALQPIATEQLIIDDRGARFALRKVSSLARKHADRYPSVPRDAPPCDPFLPWEPELFVADVTAAHVALLNKFNVIDHHLLLVTRRFLHQHMLLDADDFAALAACLGEQDALAFYNGGAAAGASQPHKHLQLVPLPLVESLPAVPVEPLFEVLRGAAGICPVPGFGFRNAFAWLAPEPTIEATGASLGRCYRALLDATGLRGLPDAEGERQSAPYNLLLTRRWMLLVPRSRESFGTISINALGYAGSLFVKDDEQFRALRRAGPLAALAAVAVPW